MSELWPKSAPSSNTFRALLWRIDVVSPDQPTYVSNVEKLRIEGHSLRLAKEFAEASSLLLLVNECIYLFLEVSCDIITNSKV